MRERPLILIAVSFAAGILFSEPSHPGLAVVSASLIAAFLIALSLPFLKSVKRPTVLALLVLTSSTMAGFGAGAVRHAVQVTIPQRALGSAVVVDGVLADEPDVTPDAMHLAVRVSAITAGGATEAASFGLAVSMPPAGPRFMKGDLLRFTCSPGRVPGSRAPGAPDPAWKMSLRDIQASCYVPRPDGIVLTRRHASAARWMHAWKDNVNVFLGKAAPGDGGAILRSLVTGDASGLSREIRDTFSRSGTAHILSISGLHTTIVAQLFFMVALALLLLIPGVGIQARATRAAALLAIAFVWCYAVFAGAQHATVRAAIMTTAYLCAIVVGRDTDLASSIAMAAIAILALEPSSIFDVSFQLSFVSVIAIAAAARRLLPEASEDPLSSCRSARPSLWLKAFLIMNFAAVAGSAPLVARVFNQVSPISPVSNLFAVPLSTFLIVPGGLLAIVLYGFWPAAAWPLAAACGRLCETLSWISSTSASIPGAFAWVSTPSWIEIILFWGGITALLFWRSGWKARTAAAALFAAALIAGFADARSHRHPGMLEVAFLDVGQGDSVFVEFPDGKTMLVDAGGGRDGRFDPGRSVVSPYLFGRRITRLDYAVLTHPHADHMNGMASVVERFRPRSFLASGYAFKDEAMGPLLEALRRTGSALGIADSSRPDAAEGGATVRFAGPPANNEFLEPNDASIVMKLTFKGRSFLLPGDIQIEGEKALLASGKDIAADVLKVAHQGSRTSTHDAFLDAVGPSHAVIMVGERNPYHLPNKEVVERLESRGVKILRTDRNGTITFLADEKGMEFSCHPERCPGQPR